MANQTNGNQFRDDEIIRLRQACPPRAGLSALGAVRCCLLLRGSAFAKGFGPIKWRGDRAEAYKSDGGQGFGGIPLKIPQSWLRRASSSWSN